MFTSSHHRRIGNGNPICCNIRCIILPVSVFTAFTGLATVALATDLFVCFLCNFLFSFDIIVICFMSICDNYMSINRPPRGM